MSAKLSRREFLRTGSRLALALGLGQSLLTAGCSGGGVGAPGADSGLPWDLLARNLQGALLRPGQAGYADLATPWNLRYAGTLPGGVAQCQSAQDVRTALQWARDHGVPFLTRSGGHSYAGFSATPGLQINTRAMNQVSYDPSTGLATVGGGATNGDVYTALTPPAVALVHGRCRPVGVAGLCLGGGIGFDMRAHGLTCDGLVETQVVTASGDLLTVNAEREPDLFWACRGAGGGNFGVHTSFTFETYPVGNLTVYQITWTTSLRQVLAALLDVLYVAPDTLGCKVTVLATPGPVFSVQLLGQLFGPATELDTLLAPVYAVQPPSEIIVQETDYWTGQDFLTEGGDPTYMQERSRYVFSRLSPAALDQIFASLEDWPGTTGEANWKLFLMGGAVDQVAPDATAYVHRGALMITSIELDWGPGDSPETVDENLAWQTAFHLAMAPYESGQCYQNFIDPSESDFLQAYYGANLPRLMEVKRRYDPFNFFHYDQGVPPG